ncbi:GntR family transcriptional regulator [Pseudolysinimonas yzui]|nr:GntR family transcriptional regulator [Pseudolysinimonas yzui]
MVSRATGITRTQRVYDDIRSAILLGTFKPGTPLRLAELAERFDVSMSVVREALTRLAEQHLVALAPRSGFRVVEISRQDLADLVDMRIEFEGMALVRSVERGDLAWQANVVSAHHVLEHTPFRAPGQPGTTDAWAEAHAAFHDALGAACGSPRLLAFTRMLRDSAELYRQISGRGPHTDRDVAEEHRRLLELAVARRADEAREALKEHFLLTARELDGLLD